jgi:TatD DNase family protein
MDACDTHAHLDQIDDLPQALKDAKQAGVVGIMAVSVDLQSCRKNLEISQHDDPKIFVGLGIHPGNIIPAEIETTLDFVRTHIRQAQAIGEIGLDFWYRWVKKDEAKKQLQRQVFVQQLEIAKEAKLPVIIHSRGAWQECFEMAKTCGIPRAVFHWYSGPVAVLKEILAAGYFVSATPSLAYSPQAREAISFAPLEQTLIETDCPVYYQGTEEAEGFQARPRDVFRTLQIYAAIKKVDPHKALQIFNANAQQVLGMTI